MNDDVLGVDVGGVIIARVNDGTDTSFFSDNYLQTSAVPNVFHVLRRLRERRFGDRIFLVSKCGPRVQEKTLHWLDHHRFYERTGLKRDHVRFCRRRREKAPICVELGVTHFVDDRLSVLRHLSSVAKRYLFHPEVSEVERFSRFRCCVKQVETWNEILADLVS